ncbi:MAG: MaoC family dehydratase N-terminal domain-containing protein, partial [Rhizobacter sp.]|nr:MaoC family dehydratase N-terminal domain-containing protein [Rhizobacter sp.]
LDDFKPGDAFETAGVTVTESMIVEFATQWDPQSTHMDVRAPRTQMLGGLMASGFLTLCITFRSFLGSGILAASNLASPGFDKLRWLKPVRPGDTIFVEAEVTSTRLSSKGDRGYVGVSYTVKNQKGDTVLTSIRPRANG